MMFQLTDVERGRFEDLLYELRYAGYAVDVHYSMDDATVDAVKGTTTIHVQFTRPSRAALYVDGTIRQPGADTIQVTRITPVITYVRQQFEEQRRRTDTEDRLKQHFDGGTK